jgi:tetratricopeptide (TPR) repeat protein
VRKALQLLEELTTRYPGYAAPWALRAECYCVLGLDAPATTREFGQLALACSERALGLAPHAAEAHAASGWAKGEYLFDHAAAEFHLKRALELKPGFVTARYVWGVAACALRRFDEGLRYLESAAALDPLSMLAQRGVAYAWFVRGDLHRAREHVLQALDLAPAAPFALYLHGLIEAEAGNTDPGIDLLRAAITQAGGTWPFIEGFVAYYLGRSGRAAEAAAAAKGLAALSPPPHMALALADLGGGRRGSAIAHLEAAARAGDPFVVHIADHPPFPHLMGEGRFDALCRRLNLPVQG